MNGRSVIDSLIEKYRDMVRKMRKPGTMTA